MTFCTVTVELMTEDCRFGSELEDSKVPRCEVCVTSAGCLSFNHIWELPEQLNIVSLDVCQQ